ncbi:ice-binding family protein [Phytoactinopolyspora halotolerans]|uniref:DUF3494 domain-containing protein n=1 Tax=Phytoactinopolyspora halotolerans TaxID=1981512 RepID=A0A6L9SIJ9_9ACTN|nr:ice-binding family protein [Phytoactinopolyspora halotolerans]NEE04151.1 DUF3494 domain-containing protein [Phytoactinopolyspora halotolerans]
MAGKHTLRFRRSRAGLAALTVASLVTVPLILNANVASAADAPVGLGTAGDFSVLASSTVTNTGPTTMEQDLGVHPGDTATGFPPGVVEGETHLADAVASQAKNDLTVAYDDAAGRTPFTNLPSELGDTTLTAGVYRISAAQLTGQLTLDAQDDPESVFIFQVDSTLVTASDSSVLLVNGASPCNVFWQVGSSATLGTDTTFVGTIMAMASITMQTETTLEGRALAQTGAVTLDSNTITAGDCDSGPPNGDEDGDEDGTEDGDEDGTEDGDEDGTEDGDEDGTEDGDEDGDEDGTEDGDEDGTEDGDEDGDEDGTEDGDEDGTEDGDEDGTEDGDEDGTEDGDEDGDEDGTEDGDEDGTEDGDEDGTEDGDEDGTEDGDEDGTEDGDEDGTEDGDGLPDTGSGSVSILTGAAALLVAMAGGLLLYRQRLVRA